MRFATIVEGGRFRIGLVRERRVLQLDLPEPGFDSIRSLAAAGVAGLRRVRDWADAQPDDAYRPLDTIALGPAVPDPGTIFAIGLNYAPAGGAPVPRPPRPFVYGKLPTSVSGHGAVVRWDRSMTANVDAEVELGIVIGAAARAVAPEEALGHVFGYTCVNDISSRDPWLDGDQWLLGKSMPGFCPVGPVIVTRDELEPDDLALGCTINGVPIQEGRTAQMLFSVAEIVSFLSRHTELRPGDLIATGTPARLSGPIGPERHLEAGDEITVWIERVGALSTSVA